MRTTIKWRRNMTIVKMRLSGKNIIKGSGVTIINRSPNTLQNKISGMSRQI